jgi:hypothetical protein
MIGLDENNLSALLSHFPRGQRQRAEKIREMELFSEQKLKEFILCHLMVLFPGQPDLTYDFPLWWNRQDQYEYAVFNDIVIHKKHQETWSSFCEQWFVNQDYFPHRHR